MRKVCVTGHGIRKLLSYGITSNDLLKELNIKFDLWFEERKEHYLFHIGGCDGMDNLTGKILIERGIAYELFVPKFDINGRAYWSKSEHTLFKSIKDNAKNIHIVEGGYLDRNDKMQMGTEVLMGYIIDPKSGTQKTIDMWKNRVRRYDEMPSGNFLLLNSNILTF